MTAPAWRAGSNGDRGKGHTRGTADQAKFTEDTGEGLDVKYVTKDTGEGLDVRNVYEHRNRHQVGRATIDDGGDFDARKCHGHRDGHWCTGRHDGKCDGRHAKHGRDRAGTRKAR